MGNTPFYNFDDLKNMTIDALIEKCTPYVKNYLSEKAAAGLKEAYAASNFKVVKHILDKTRTQIKNRIGFSEYQKAEKALMDEFPDFETILCSSENNEGSHSEDMNTGTIIMLVAIAVIALAALAVGIRNLAVKKKTVGKVLSKGSKKGNHPNYTDKDKALMELIHELSIVYDNTDKYLKG